MLILVRARNRSTGLSPQRLVGPPTYFNIRSIFTTFPRAFFLLFICFCWPADQLQDAEIKKEEGRERERKR